ncbi:MAG: ACT domain-containing protein [Bacteroidetes bacterium]|nr:MAG: ACT domain-containing protein [Bacteroidota bacterium]
MVGETNLKKLISNMEPVLNPGDYVFVSVTDLSAIPREITVCEIKEKEGVTVVLKKTHAELLNLSFEYVAAWITLNVHSSLEAVGLTAAFSAALARHGISCNVVAGYYHDHIFVDQKDGEKALRVLREMRQSG